VALPQVSDQAAVWAAIDEYDEIGGRAFHEKYGFGPSDEYLVSARGGCTTQRQSSGPPRAIRTMS
jgi:hypothetical protein